MNEKLDEEFYSCLIYFNRKKLGEMSNFSCDF